jgi:chromosome segregation ATPase
MSQKIEDLEAQLSELTNERTELDTAIEELIADMADAPPEQRTTGGWAPNGELTRKYLDLTNRQAAVEKDIIDLSRQIAADGKPSLPN